MEALVKPSIDPEGDVRFRELVQSSGLDPDNRWVGGYVDYEWDHGRHVYQTADAAIAGKVYLEFGCNYGGTTVVLALLGARVIAVDIDDAALRIAAANADRYGVATQTAFLRCSTRAQLPFATASFDAVVCNSVLEYVAADLLPASQRELDRVLKPGGLLIVAGTSNRLSPYEMHSGRWLTNYVPQFIARWFGTNAAALPRGVSPRQVRHGFGAYDNLDWQDGGRAYLEARARMSPRRRERLLRKCVHSLARAFGVSLGLLTPSLSVTLRKRGSVIPE